MSGSEGEDAGYEDEGESEERKADVEYQNKAASVI